MLEGSLKLPKSPMSSEELKVVDFKPEYNFKVIVLGDVGIGKSCLLQRLHKNEFIIKQPTIGVDNVNFDSTLDGGTFTRLRVWDTAGSEAFRSMPRLFSRDASAAIVCFKLPDRQTFLNVP